MGSASAQEISGTNFDKSLQFWQAYQEQAHKIYGNEVWGVVFTNEKEIDYASTMAIAQRFDIIIQALPEYELPTGGTIEEHLQNPEKSNTLFGYIFQEAGNAIAANGFAGRAPKPNTFTLTQNETHFHGDVSTVKACRGIELNLGSVNHAPSRTRPSRMVKQVVHALSHVGQNLICEDESMQAFFEPTAQLMTAESLAWLANNDRKWALEPFLVHLREMALLSAWQQASNEGREASFWAALRGVSDTYSDTLGFDLRDGHRYGDMDQNTKQQVQDLAVLSLNTLIHGTVNENTEVEGLSLVGIYWESTTGKNGGLYEGRDPRIVQFDDTRKLLMSL